jgi:hypothetical protein
MNQPVHPAVVPPFLRPPEPELPLRAAFWWTCVFSFLGVMLAVAALLLVLVLVLLVFFGAIAAIADSFTLGDIVGDISLGDVAAVGLSFGVVFLVAGLVSVALSTVMLLLMRLLREFRTWQPVLQGLSAAGATYLVGSMLATVFSTLSDLFLGDLFSR